ncbi:MAG: DUF4390 domain-containing protein [Betaproteobacteria bacterium]|nr:DUF4390 domain-containing protein [Betaproteobacteria bacterium]
MPLVRLFLVLLALLSGPVQAEGIAVKSAELSLEEEERYLLNAEFEFAFNATLEEALQHGVPLYFTLEFELNRPRWYWLDESVSAQQFTYRVSYNALTRQYRLSSGLYNQNVGSLEDVVRLLSRVRGRPVVDRAALQAGVNYQAAVRFRLDVAQMPKPFQLSALGSRDWNMQSEWRRWMLTP